MRATRRVTVEEPWEMPEKPGNPGYVLRRDPDTLRIPDASFVSWDRVPEGGVPDGYWPGAPDLAVEIVSPNGRADDVHDKVREYLEAGTKAVRVLWPKHRSVTAYARPDATVQDLGPEDELNGETRCPASG